MKTATSTTPTQASKKIDSIIANRLYHEKGMSVRAIAEECGVCVNTVRRHLGPISQSRRVAVNGSTVSTRNIGEVTALIATRPKQLIPSKIELKGKTAVFEIDHVSRTLLMRGTSFEITMDHDEAALFLEELAEACESIPSNKSEIVQPSEPLDDVAL